MSLWPTVLALALVLAGPLPGGLQAHALGHGEGEGAKLAVERERAQLLQRFDDEERSCAQRFRVNDCLEDSRSRRRAALAPLRERLLALDAAERERKAQARQDAVARKQADRTASLAATAEAASTGQGAQRAPGASLAFAPATEPATAPATTPRSAAPESAERAPNEPQPALAPASRAAPAPAAAARNADAGASAARQRALALRQAQQRRAQVQARIDERLRRQRESLALQGRTPDRLAQPLPEPPRAGPASP